MTIPRRVFFLNLAFSWSQTVFSMNTTKFKPPRYRHMIYIGKKIDTRDRSIIFEGVMNMLDSKM